MNVALPGVQVLRREWRIIAIAACAAAVVTVGAVAIKERRWTSSASFTPQSSRRQSLGALGGLASQLGVAIPGGEPNQSPQFYADLLRSRAVLEDAVRHEFRFQSADGTSQTRTLAQALDIDEPTPAREVAETMRMFGRRISVAVSPRTGVVTVTVALNDAAMAQEVLRWMLERLNAFNNTTRQTQAMAERRFAEQRVASARQTLDEAERRESEFARRNRDFRSSPDLSLQAERLRREAQLQQQLYTTLVQLLEQARIEEVRDTPVLTVLDPPSLAARPDSRGVVRAALWGLLLGATVGVILAARRSNRTGVAHG
jgi:uncharacterized protein involved in exopolysaccharide biosynthesis